MAKNTNIHADNNRKAFTGYLLFYAVAVLIVGVLSYAWAYQTSFEKTILEEELQELQAHQYNIDELNKMMDDLQALIDKDGLHIEDFSEQSHRLMYEIEVFTQEKQLGFGSNTDLISKYVNAKKTSLEVNRDRREIQEKEREIRTFERALSSLNRQIRVCCP